MELADEALVLTSLPHGENGAVVRFLTMGHGLRAGYVPGARGKAKRAALHPGNRVALSLRARAEGQLAGATLELVKSRALIGFEPGGAAILAWVTELTAAALAEAVPHPRLAEALDALLEGLAAGLQPVSARAALARYELLLLEEEGFGLDLASCALGGPVDDLAFVSPKSGRAVSREKADGQPWEGQLLPLPRFLRQGGAATAEEARAALALTRHFLARHWLSGARLEGLRGRAAAER
ncbi:DNA repair protein RecO [Sandaracinobacter sp. RS1-74]|uniref:DNA repair protein RecO n=1 Tax=Sandaracinobacteroides sayramensis TaxID=2913411 RepID=UPI001EDB7351|nr:DNA repair protein RecO [Sandaracinobacteroides sayramensis]MCG2840977.1 DNA repair protein RecO [Sandaracinobacteroides sayramensis]